MPALALLEQLLHQDITVDGHWTSNFLSKQHFYLPWSVTDGLFRTPMLPSEAQGRLNAENLHQSAHIRSFARAASPQWALGQFLVSVLGFAFSPAFHSTPAIPDPGLLPHPTRHPLTGEDQLLWGVWLHFPGC
jgi:hypothetical protein